MVNEVLFLKCINVKDVRASCYCTFREIIYGHFFITAQSNAAFNLRPDFIKVL